jgi:BirA family transcriptional regulator, biotin operon repressor / biotin---[acetyl-CoA-carboxylase] ligase
VKFDQHQFEAALQHPYVQVNEMRQVELPQFVVHWFESLASTNQTLWQLMAQHPQEGTVVMAREQQAGKGQWGRQWQSPPGGLYLSIALMPCLSVEQGSQLTLCSAWGIATALRQQGVPVELKWLNDLVVSGRKLGGILTETKIQQGAIRQAVIGIGLNWSNPVPETGINLQMIRAEQSSVSIASLEVLAAIVLQGVMMAYHYWQIHGIEPVLMAYESLLTGLGRSITVDDQVGEIVGVSQFGDLRVCVQQGAAPSTEINLPPGSIRLGYG